MTTTTAARADDTVLPFQLDRSDARGRVARLDATIDRILSQHNYPAPVAAMVAELVLLTALIGPMVKLRWKLSIQVRGNGPIRTIAADYYAPTDDASPARIRGWASYDADRLSDDEPFSQIGEGYFAILIDQGPDTEPYHGITPLDARSLADCARAYFAQSEQIPTSFKLAYGRSTLPGQTESWRGGGVMIQTLPGQSPPAPDLDAVNAADILQGSVSEDWSRINILLGTASELELIGPSVTPDTLLLRLFHEETPRVSAPVPVEFGCGCSEARVRDSLAIYSAKDIATMTTEQGLVTADCQFCGAHYEFDPRSLGFEATLAPDGSPADATPPQG